MCDCAVTANYVPPQLRLRLILAYTSPGPCSSLICTCRVVAVRSPEHGYFVYVMMSERQTFSLLAFELRPAGLPPEDGSRIFSLVRISVRMPVALRDIARERECLGMRTVTEYLCSCLLCASSYRAP